VYQLLLALPEGKAAGLDNMDNKLLRIAAEHVSTPLCYIINLSFVTSVYPSEWKKAKVVPIPKSTTEPFCGANSRPISLLPTTSKIMERIVCKQVSDYFSKNSLMSENQHAYRKNHSTCTALLHMVDDWYHSIDQGKLVGAIFLDFSAAFDLVDHNCLLSKLACYGFDESTTKWMASYLTGREQCVHINGTNSSFKELPCGVPQGSCLGPLLFTIYTNDLPLAITQATADMYADDTSAYICAPSIETISHNLQTEVNNICSWVRVNRLFLNTSKTKCIVLGSKPKMSAKPKLTLTANGKVIEQVSEVKLLGSTVDECLTWNTHTKLTSKKMARSLGMIKRCAYLMDQTLLKIVIECLVLSHIDYCSPVWSCTTKTNINLLQRMQNKATRLFQSKPQWKPVHTRLSINTMTTFKRITLTNEPICISRQLRSVNNLHSYRTRFAAKQSFLLEKPRTNALMKCFMYRAVRVWNNLPIVMQSTQSLRVFKDGLHKYFHQ